MTHPLVRKRGGYWRIYVGQSRYCLPDYFTNLHAAATAAASIRTQWRATT